MNTSLSIKKGPIIRKMQYDAPYKIIYYFKQSMNQPFELLQIELKPNETYISNGHSDKSLEYILVLEGELTLTIGVRTQVIAPDECVDFIPSSKHSYHSTGTCPLKAVIIHYYNAI